MSGRGGSAPPTSLVEVLQRHAEERPEVPVFRFLADGEEESDRSTFAGLDHRVRCLASRLLEVAEPGDRALLLYNPGLEFIRAFLACLYAGVVAVPLLPPRPNRGQERVRRIAADAAPAALLTESALEGRLQRIGESVPALLDPSWLTTDELPDGEGQGERSPPLPDSDSLAFLQYTSGSTASPKGVRVSHANLVHNQRMIREAFGQSAESVIVGWLPLYHDMGLIGNVLQPLYLGAQCILMSPVSFLQRPRRWLAAVSRHRATTSGGPNFAYELCLERIDDEEAAGLDLSSWSVAFNGAEPVRADTMQRFSRRFEANGFRHRAFFPCYGLAEATLFVTGGEVSRPAPVQTVDAGALEDDAVVLTTRRAAGARRLVGCGRTRDAQRLLIVDPRTRREVAPGRVGEIWIAGPSVARGYWRREEASRETFGARLADRDDGPYLRTGDLGFEHDGDLFITGRLKDLIILRGRNLYPQDLERTAESSHPHLRSGGTAAFPVEREDEEVLVLVAEVERRRDQEPAAVFAAVRQALAEEHEVRVHDIVLIRAGTLPRTTSGKVRRHACRDAYLEDAMGGRAVAVASELAREQEDAKVSGDPLVAELQSRIGRHLGIRSGLVDPDTPLTALGLDSLSALQIKHAVEERYGVGLPLGQLLEGLSLSGVARRVREAEGDAASSGRPSQAGDGAVALTPGQRALWILESVAGGAPFNILTAAVRGDETPEPEALRASLADLVARHPALRIALELDEEGEPVQRVHPEMALDFAVVDLPDAGEGVVRQRLLDDGEAGFDLLRGPLFRVRLYRLGDGGCALLFAAHHLISDLWSAVILFEELELLYDRHRNDTAAELPPPGLPFPEWVERQRHELEGPRGEALLEHWRTALEGAPQVLELPTDRPRPAVQSFRGSLVRRRVPTALHTTAAALASEEGTTLFNVLLTAFGAVLARYSGQDDLLVGSPTYGRESSELAGTVGYLVNPLPIRLRPGGGAGFREVLRRTRHSVRDVLQHHGMPLLHLVEHFHVERDRSRSPLFQVFFAFEVAQEAEREALVASAVQHSGAFMRLFGNEFRSVGLDRRGAQFDLMLLAGEIDGGLLLTCEYNSDLFDEATAERVLVHLENLLAGAVADPELPVARLPLLSEGELRQVLTEWAGGEEAGVPEETLHGLFARQAAATPERIAAVCGVEEITYGELDRRSAALGAVLRREGVGPESAVALSTHRSLGLVVAILAVLRAGGGYVPLDPAHPVERRRYILRDAAEHLGCAVLLADPAVVEDELAEEVRDLGITTLDATGAPEAPQGGAESPPVDASNLAYVIYTSGSTGRPKGVAVTHGNAVRLFTRTRRWFDFGEDDVWTLFHSFGFDFSVWEIWGALLHGGRLVVVPRALSRSPEAFYDLLRFEGVTVLSQTPSAFRQLVAVDGERREELALRWVVFGGEALDVPVLEPWIERRGTRTPVLVNMYGITETTVHVTYRPVEPGDAAPGRGSRIGVPIPDLTTVVLGPDMQPVPPGVPGEIHVGGEGLARGYVGRPALTAERFIPDPFGSRPGGRLYRTGDLARWRPGGDLEYLGRIDDQLQIRGFRIEPGEIEAALLRHADVTECAVVPRGEGDEQRLVAYVVPEAGRQPEPGALRAHLATRVPDYMVPAAFVAMAALPLTANGKVDRRSLPEPEDAAHAAAAGGRPPATPTERTLAQIWEEVLDVGSVSADDDFFELGGHSLLNVRMVARIRQRFGVDLPLARVFEASVLERVAVMIEEAGGAPDREVETGIERRPEGSAPVLSYAQEALWISHELDPDSVLFNVPVALRVEGGVPEPGRLSRCLTRIAGRHEILRTAVESRDGEPVVSVREGITVPVRVVDLRTLRGRVRERELQRRLLAEGLRPFRLGQPPLLRALLAVVAEDRAVLLVTLHHFVADHWSLGVLIRELGALYRVDRPLVDDPLPPLPIQYGDFALWERERVDSQEVERQRRYWRRRLRGAPRVLDLPTDHPRPPVRSFRGGLIERPLPPELGERLRGLARGEDVTLFMVLLAAYYALLHRWSGQDDLCVGTDVATRDRLELEPLIGLFVNQVVLRTELSGDPTFRELLERVRHTTLEAFDHAEVPFRRLVEDLVPQRDPSAAPLFQVLFDLHNTPVPDLRLDDMELHPLQLDRRPAKFDLSLFVGEGAEGDLVATLEFAAELFETSTAERFMARYQRLLESAVDDPDRPLSRLSLETSLPEADLVRAFNEELS